MNCYLVVADDLNVEGLRNQFQEQHVYALRPPGVWAIGTPLLTCADVSAAIGLGNSNGGIVVKLGEHYGFYDPALWQKLEAWRQI